MQRAERALDELGIRLLVVTFEAPPAARAYAGETGFPWPVLSDEDRQLYGAYGMGRAKWRHLLGASAMRAYAREWLRGRWPRWPAADPMQQGGDVLIDPDGIVRFAHAAAGPGDRPPVDRLLEARYRADAPGQPIAGVGAAGLNGAVLPVVQHPLPEATRPAAARKT